MLLSAYSSLIGELPYRDQAFETKKTTWSRKEYEEHEEFNLFLDDAFSKGEAITLSRQDLFKRANEDVIAAVFSIIFWGYPRNMRGNTFESILEALLDIKKVLSGNRELNTVTFAGICEQLKGTGIGLSTLSKFLYFFGFNLEGHRCLILDSRIIDVLNTETFVELKMGQAITEWNKEDQYLQYLKMMEDVAKANGYSVDQLELFLFMFGRNLKAVHA
jgi:thermostable 8-oxoguanine DNA glycosylase